MRRRAIISNRRAGGLWWRIPAATALWLVFAVPVVTGIAMISVLRDYARDLPRVPDLERWESQVPRTTEIIAADGSVVAQIPFSAGDEVGHRFPIAYRDVPERMVQAVLAAEDVRFFSHRGVDMQAVVRAALANYRAGRVVEGASTITQQVARNLLPEQIGNERSLRRKVREALLARRIERRYPKQRILEVYVNHVFLGANAYGIAAAARSYFDRSLAELSLAQTAMIAGLAQAPGRADPYLHPDLARQRRDEVLERMRGAGFIDDGALAAARAEPIALSPPPVAYGTLAPWHTERARREVEEADPVGYARGGLRIETSAQPALALEAEASARARSQALAPSAGRPPEVAALVLDHQTGYVEATVGGLDWAHSRFDRATQACRQPGSAFKPVVYAAALETDAITPGTALRDAPIAEYDEVLDVHWKPTNSGRSFRGVALAQDALAASLNAPAVDVLDRVGAARVKQTAVRLGITTEIDDVRPLALGASCVIPIELARAFSVFARSGRAVEPIFVVRITRGDETLVDRASWIDPTLSASRRLDRAAALAVELVGSEPIYDPRSAFLMTSMLRDVVLRGTGTGARAIGRPAAGKTGTTNDNTDAWFVGFTARVTAAVWVGHDDPALSLGPRQDGAHAALPLWNQLAIAAEGDRAPRELTSEVPDGLVRARVDRETGLIAQPGAGGALDLWFKQGTEPTQMAGQAPGVPASLPRVTREF